MWTVRWTGQHSSRLRLQTGATEHTGDMNGGTPFEIHLANTASAPPTRVSTPPTRSSRRHLGYYFIRLRSVILS